ncbi:SpoVK/Ycf46/Vps4 family AAA+-type ATPase [Paenibacillus pabuli]|uniref:SpoVK/Ycf46/Vps4 family AAA+-type ATPase n=1 Tax=Paenibacillus pabuli TaxID=1472 RepID=A0ABX9BKP6_9BACL|nr:AAA family ATPase [Paenibacillus pabuli]RAI97059.1 SpoVK/Ycf46/Vps4 family AAA+-type ATPase [Paenibacillus pabuli]
MERAIERLFIWIGVLWFLLWIYVEMTYYNPVVDAGVREALTLPIGAISFGFLVCSFCLNAYRKESYSVLWSALSYVIFSIGFLIWTVVHFEVKSIQYIFWIPLLIGIIVYLKKISPSPVKGLMLGLLVTLGFRSLTVEEPTTYFQILNAFSYYGLDFAFSHWWVLLFFATLYTWYDIRFNRVAMFDQAKKRDDSVRIKFDDAKKLKEPIQILRMPESIAVSQQQKDQSGSKAAQSDNERQKVYLEALNAINNLIGLTDVKVEVKNFIMELEGQKKLKDSGIEESMKATHHMIFSGPPGTGKTEVARLMAKVLYGMGALRSDAFVEADRSTIVGQHIGETEENMKNLISKARGGVLFIDEAYALAKSDSPRDFGQEAINVLIPAMENYRDDLVVILAGYQSDMERLMDMNEGFRSRIPYKFNFKDYTPRELALLALKMLESNRFICSAKLEDIERIISLNSKNGALDGNGRTVRTLIEQSIRNHKIRITKEENSKVGEIELRDIQQAAGLRSKIDAEKEFDDRLEGNNTIKKEALDQLEKLIGLDDIKDEIKRILNFIEIEQKRIDKGISSEKMSMHMIFAGPPGTGKTTVARIVGKFLKGIGILSNGHFIEVDRGHLIGEYVGQTAPKVKNVISKAKGGVLFIDEAYSLAEQGNGFGQEAIDTLIKEMEDKRDDLVVIFAGYEKEMQKLLDMNPGFDSRVPNRIVFPDYSPVEILEILSVMLRNFTLGEHARRTLQRSIHNLAEQNEGVLEGNARWARNLFDQIRMEQNSRIAQTKSDDLVTVMESDIAGAFNRLNKNRIAK